MVLENDPNGVENEGIFVQTRHPLPRQSALHLGEDKCLQ